MRLKISGFTPVFDSMLEKFGGTVALVYGKIWRYCDWSPLSVCTAGNKRLAEELDLSESTIKRSKALLESEGFIKIVGKTGGTDTVSVMHEAVLNIEIKSDVGTGHVVEQPKIERTHPKIDPLYSYAGSDVDWMWPQCSDKIKAIPSSKWDTLSESKKKRWNKWVQDEWKHYTPAQIAQAYEVHKKSGMSWSGPWSMDWALENLEGGETSVDKRKRDLYGE